jgi:hypothetical protein
MEGPGVLWSQPRSGVPLPVCPESRWLESGVVDGEKPAHMMPENAEGTGRSGVDPRAAALSRYLRRTAAFFSMSADATDSASTADLGMALLDAARIAEAMSSADPRIKVLSEARLFESMPEGKAVFIEVAEIRRAVRRTLVSGPQDGASIIAELIRTANELTGSPGGRSRPPDRDEAASTHERAPDAHGQRRLLSLGALFEAVDVARAGLQACRAAQPSTEREIKRQDLVLALQAYVQALEAWPLPVPYALRTELALNQGLLRGSR